MWFGWVLVGNIAAQLYTSEDTLESVNQMENNSISMYLGMKLNYQYADMNVNCWVILGHLLRHVNATLALSPSQTSTTWTDLQGSIF